MSIARVQVHLTDGRILPLTLDMAVDCAQGPGAFTNRQFSKICASHLMYHTVPTDFMSLAQLASMQCKRAELFRVAPI
jgi:hypothetical protein